MPRRLTGFQLRTESGSEVDVLRCVVIFLTLGVAAGLLGSNASGACSQGPFQRANQGRSPKIHQEGRISAERKMLIRKTTEGMREAAPSLDLKRAQRFERTLQRVIAEVSPAEIRRLSESSLRERIKRVYELERTHRRARDEAFLKGLDPTEAAVIRKLPHSERTRRITDLRLEHELETAITNAMAQGLITEEAAAELRAADRRTQLAGARRLNKSTFFQVHRDSLSKGKVDRLEKLSAKAFFNDPDVRRFRLLDGLDAQSMKAIRQLDSAQRRQLLSAIRSGEDADLLSPLSSKSLGWLQGLSSPNRKRLSRELERIRLRKSRRLAIPKHLKSQLIPEDRRAFLRLDDNGRVAWLQKRFPNEDWNRIHRRFNDQRQLDGFLESLDSTERRAIARMSPSRLEEFVNRRVDAPSKIKTLLSAARGRGWGRHLRLPSSLSRRLSPEELRRIKTLPSEEAILWLIDRFRRELLPAVGRLLRLAGLSKLPARGELPDRRQVHSLVDAYGGPRALCRRLGDELERRRRPQRR